MLVGLVSDMSVINQSACKNSDEGFPTIDLTQARIPSQQHEVTQLADSVMQGWL